MKRFGLLALTLALSAVMAGCGSKSSTRPDTTDPAAAKAEVDAGNAALVAGDYAAANQHYKAAIAKDPTNPQARFGAGVTEVYVLRDDPDLKAVVDQFTLPPVSPVPSAHGSPSRSAALAARVAGLRTGSGGAYTPENSGRALFRMLALAADAPDSISEIQALIRTRVMPRLQYAEAQLNFAETATNFVMTFPPAVTGLPDTIEVDNTEVYLLDALVNGVQGWLGVLVAYNFDVENSDFDHVNAESLLTPGTAWAALNPDGATVLAQAKADLQTVQVRFGSAATYLANETDDQTDDLIPKSWLESQGYLDMKNGIAQVTATLAGPVAISVNDYAGQPFGLDLYAGRFFVPAIQDLKLLLPHHTFVSGGLQIDRPIIMPDPTMNGIFPDMTNPRWQQLTGLTGPVAARVSPRLRVR